MLRWAFALFFLYSGEQPEELSHIGNEVSYMSSSVKNTFKI